jgi:hypothetical protein
VKFHHGLGVKKGKSSELSSFKKKILNFRHFFFVLVQFAEEGSESFPLEVIHGGFFVGSGCNRAYLDGTKVFYDDCDCDSWSALWLEDVISEISSIPFLHVPFVARPVQLTSNCPVVREISTRSSSHL